MQEVCTLLRKNRYKLKKAAKVPLAENAVAETVYQLSAAKDTEVSLDLAIDPAKNLVVVNNLTCPEERLTESLADLNRVSLALDSDTVLIQSGQGVFSDWHNQGFTKQYQCILAGEPGSLDMEKVDQTLEQTAAEISCCLDEEVQIYELASDLPYIYSVDLVEASAESPIEADYHCHLHYHELTGAVYLDRLWIPDDKRRQGIGNATVDILKESLAAVGANYLYLKATESSESFWDRRTDFDSYYRLNLKWARRMRRQMRREPGWDRVYVKGVCLDRRLDYYGNHPGEDWDFFQAQELLHLAGEE